MPVKQRKAKHRAHVVTADALEAFVQGDHIGLHRALGLKPWQPSPFDIDGPEPPHWTRQGDIWNEHWPLVAGLRAELDGLCSDRRGEPCR